MISGSLLSTNPFEEQVQQLMQIEQQKKVQLQNQQKILQDQKTALSDIDSKLSALNSTLSSFIDLPEEQLSPLSGTSSNTDAFGVLTTSGLDGPSTFSLDINQVAKRDIMLSDEVTATNTDYNTTGTGSFDIAIGSDHLASINVDTTGLNNEEVMNAIAAEINTQLGDHVTASVLKPQDGTVRLSIKSSETGKANRITITNQQDDLAAMNLNSHYTENELDAKFILDGVAFERSSNLIDDAVDGLSFEIKKETSAQETLEVTRDIETAEESIREFVEQFNSLNSLIREKTFLNGDTGNRGILQNERSIRNLSLMLRQDAALPVNSLGGSSIQSLGDIGIEFSTDGSMTISDEERLTEVLSDNSGEVVELFTADDGIGAVLQQRIDRHIGNGTIFDSIEDSFDRKIDRLDNRIEREEDYLVQREEQLRQEFDRLSQVINEGQQQFNNVLNFQNQWFF